MQGYTYGLVQKYFRPWCGDISKRSDFSNTINPAFTMRLFAEVVGTLGVLANTDARAQYRLRFTLAPGNSATGSNGLTTTAPTTQPTVTVNVYIETYAQPDLQDLLGNAIEQVPRGIVASRFNMHEIPVVTSGNNVIRATLTGNELRGLMLLFRNGNTTQTRTNLTDTNTGAIDLRLDNRRLWKMKPSQWVEEMAMFYPFLGAGTWTREAGMYIYPRYNGGGPVAGEGLVGEGDYWLQTVEQSLIQFEFGGADISTSPGTVEIVYDALAIAGQVPPNLEGV
jgi:hypothetical protein